MNKSIIFGIILISVIVYGCTSSQTITFEQGVERINEIDNQYGADMKTVPNSTVEINGLLAELMGFSTLNKDMPLQLKYIFDFRIKSLEAEKLHTEGWQWDRGSTTDWGFGCKKGYARITNSSKIRNASAQKGYEALNALESLIDEFPEEAKELDLTQKDVLFLSAAYQLVEDKARRDAGIVENFCNKKEGEDNTI